MLKAVFEKTYTQYSGVQKVTILAEYLEKIPGADTKKFVKMLVAGKNGFGIYNISGIEAVDDGKKVKIIYTGDEASSAMSMKRFAKRCKEILNEVGLNDQVKLVAQLDGTEKEQSFRFYYDNTKNVAILVRNTNVEGLEKFLKDYEGDIAAAISLPKTRAQLKGGSSKSKEDKPMSYEQRKRAEGYVCVASYDDYGHKITLWRKEPYAKKDDTKKA